MEQSDISPDNSFKGSYNELLCQDDSSTHEQPQHKDRIPARSGYCSRHCRLVAVCLGLLAAVLLIANIALGVQYHSTINSKLLLYDNVTQINNDLKQMHAKYHFEIQAKEEAQSMLTLKAEKLSQEKAMLEVQIRQSENYKTSIQSLAEEKTKLEYRNSQAEASCGHCMPGWILLYSTCYYFHFSTNIPRKGWQGARDSCIEVGADLAVIDSWEKQEKISEVIFEEFTETHLYINGFWIGLTDVGVEGSWTWLNETDLTQGYWDDGEPNDFHGVEDCGAIYPTNKYRQNWNDAPCTHPLKWICEKAMSNL